jgi:ribosome maturation factor RimP
LSKPEHFKRFLGRRARVKTLVQIDGRNDFKGELIDADAEHVTLAGSWGTISIGYDQIRRSNLLPASPGDS